jgi:hypothetical protein
MARKRAGYRGDLRGGDANQDADGAVKHVRWDQEVTSRTSKRFRRSRIPNFIYRCIGFIIHVIRTMILEPLGQFVGLILMYLIGLAVIVAVLRYSIYHLPSFFPGLSVALRLVPKISHVPTVLWCTYFGYGCSLSGLEELKNVTSSANAQIQQASKVINSMDRLSFSRADLMSNSVSLGLEGTNVG